MEVTTKTVVAAVFSALEPTSAATANAFALSIRRQITIIVELVAFSARYGQSVMADNAAAQRPHAETCALIFRTIPGIAADVATFVVPATALGVNV